MHPSSVSLLLVTLLSAFTFTYTFASSSALENVAPYLRSFVDVDSHSGSLKWSCCRICPENFYPDQDQQFGVVPDPVVPPVTKPTSWWATSSSTGAAGSSTGAAEGAASSGAPAPTEGGEEKSEEGGEEKSDTEEESSFVETVELAYSAPTFGDFYALAQKQREAKFGVQTSAKEMRFMRLYAKTASASTSEQSQLVDQSKRRKRKKKKSKFKAGYRMKKPRMDDVRLWGCCNICPGPVWRERGTDDMDAVAQHVSRLYRKQLGWEDHEPEDKTFIVPHNRTHYVPTVNEPAPPCCDFCKARFYTEEDYRQVVRVPEGMRDLPEKSKAPGEASFLETPGPSANMQPKAAKQDNLRESTGRSLDRLDPKRANLPTDANAPRVQILSAEAAVKLKGHNPKCCHRCVRLPNSFEIAAKRYGYLPKPNTNKNKKKKKQRRRPSRS